MCAVTKCRIQDDIQRLATEASVHPFFFFMSSFFNHAFVHSFP